jgi:hypothetical protein
MRRLHVVLVLLALVPPAAARAAARRATGSQSGTTLELGVGGDYIVDPQIGDLQLTLAADGPLGRMVSAGVRAGVLFTTSPLHVGAPIDFRLRIHGQRFYVDGLVGPWFLFGTGDTFRIHGAIGVGLRTAAMTIGLEAGVLDTSGIVGLRLAFPIY